ncbi:MAG: alpha/beta hydrolase [Cytophagaceae bacterium]|nr:alpha/beta hydrolase [Cytophagaceae bacterium]
MFKPLHYRFLPAPNQANVPTILLLHGTGGDENDLVPVGQQLAPNFNILSVRGNVLENGAPRFFRRLSMGVFDEDDLRFRADELADFLEKTTVREGIDPQKLIALGYSNGANIGGALLLRHPHCLAGAVLWRAMLPLQEPAPPVGSNGAPVLLLSGSSDPYFRPDVMPRYEQWLSASGFQVEHQVLTASHGLITADFQRTTAWLQRYFPL